MRLGHHLLLQVPRAAEVNKAAWTRAKHLISERDRDECLVCGTEATDIHHRMPKGMGGTSDPDRNYGLANLVSLCRKDHDHVHANPEESYANGLLVHSWDDPVKCPLILADETVVTYLTVDGKAEKYQQQALF